MACSYYEFRYNDYYCYKKKEYVNEDVYYKYCRNYDYDDCPIYKGETSSGGCYITTACMYALGCGETCKELNVLRDFRDTYICQTKTGQADLQEYYRFAPQIVNAIDASKNKVEIYKKYLIHILSRVFCTSKTKSLKKHIYDTRKCIKH